MGFKKNTHKFCIKIAKHCSTCKKKLHIILVRKLRKYSQTSVAQTWITRTPWMS